MELKKQTSYLIRPFIGLAFLLALTTSSTSATTYTVTNTGDAGVGSLRQAIIDANANAGGDNISFSISGTAPHTINVLSPLPDITETISIDGTTQPANGYTGNNPKIALFRSGSYPANSQGLKLTSAANFSSIKGLSIVNFNTLSNGGLCIFANNVTVTENVVSHNTHGILASGTVANPLSGIVIKGNKIGTNESGTSPNGNLNMGILFSNASGIIGGTLPADANLTSGNITGIYLIGNCANTIIQGNKIGTNLLGTATLQNAAEGIHVVSNNVTIIDNLISGNGNKGIYLNGSPSLSGIIIKGNKIGTDITGTLPLGNAQYGIYISNANGNTLGGSVLGDANTIAYNGTAGIYVIGTSATTLANNNLISRNTIYGSPKSINLNYLSSFPGNNAQAAPIITTGSYGPGTGIVNGTAGSNNTIELFKSNSGGLDALTFIGFATAAGSGAWTIPGLTLANGDKVIATATDATNNTSEFSSAFTLTQFCPTTYTVTTTSDSGPGSLRQGIIEANNNSCGGDVDTIVFNIPGAAQTITLLSALPVLTDPNGVLINGYTAAGAIANTNLTGPLNGTLKIEVTSTTVTEPLLEISATSSNNTIKGLVFKNTAANGTAIKINSNNNQILGCYIGIDKAGANATGSNMANGVWINNAGNNKIGDGTAAGRNLITGLSKTLGATKGILINGGALATNNSIKGNIIGLLKNGTAAPSNNNELYGIYIASGSTNIIGGTVLGEGNVISGMGVGTSGGKGIYIAESASNSILGNTIGPDYTGNTAIPSNAMWTGIELSINAANNSIGSAASGARNIISGLVWEGIVMQYTGCTGNKVQGNYIGLSANGNTLVATSALYGIELFNNGGGGNTIGGNATLGEGNVIVGKASGGSGSYGIFLRGGANTVKGNIIGLKADGATVVSAGVTNWDYGIEISSNGNTIGGATLGEGNTISNNGFAGIGFLNPLKTGNVIQGNYIGSSATGTYVPTSNQPWGIKITAVNKAYSNLIGGSAPGQGNTIAFNSAGGIYIYGTSSNYNKIVKNSIYNTNTPFASGKAIDLGGTGNNAYAKPIILNATTTGVNGTAANNGDSVEVFQSDVGGINALEYLGTAVVNSGVWNLPAILNFGTKVVANVRSASNGNTSEFSAGSCVPIPTAPITVTANSTICSGSSQTLVANGGTAYTWSPAAGLNTVIGSTVIASPTVTTTYTVTATLQNCFGATQTYYATTQLVVVPLAFTVDAGPNALVCKDESVILGANPTANSGSCNNASYIYSWQPITGLNSPNIANPVATVDSTTMYYLTVYTAGTAMVTDSVLITLKPTPSVSVSANTTALCQGQSANLQATGAGTFTWSPATGLSTTNNSTTTATPSASTNYVVILKDAANCTAQAEIFILVLPTPVITTSGNKTICLGSSVQLNATTSASTLQWSPATGLSSINIASPVASPTATTTYNVSAANGTCTAQASLTVSVYQHASSLFTYSYPGANVVFTFPANTFPPGQVSYVWTFGDSTGNTTTQNTQSHTYGTSGTFHVCVTVTDACGSSTYCNDIQVDTNPSGCCAGG